MGDVFNKQHPGMLKIQWNPRCVEKGFVVFFCLIWNKVEPLNLISALDIESHNGPFKPVEWYVLV